MKLHPRRQGTQNARRSLTSARASSVRSASGLGLSSAPDSLATLHSRLLTATRSNSGARRVDSRTNCGAQHGMAMWLVFHWQTHGRKLKAAG